MSVEKELIRLPFITKKVIDESTVEDYEKDKLLADGDQLRCTSLHVVLEGQIRIYTMDEEGREVSLYEVASNEICINSAAHLFSDVQYKVFAKAKSKVKILKIPKGTVEKDLLSDKRFFKYIMTKVMTKMNDLSLHYQMNVLSNLDRRLEFFLAKRFKEGKHIYITHKALAQEIGTSREVVSRKLKNLEKQGKIKLSRGKISV